MVTDISKDETELGNYFIANYPPFAFWKKDYLPIIEKAFQQKPENDVPLGLYMHIPFCRKRCKFCYFRVYTDVNAKQIQAYVDALSNEIAMIAHTPAVENRTLRFVYFGGGTPSYLSSKQLKGLVAKISEHMTWEKAEEVTFECEPGTLKESKLETLKEIGVTRLSLGIENFNDAILEENGRAHLSKEVYNAYGWIQNVGFPQVNIDLIAGMVGETWENWKTNIEKTIELDPDSVTVYQMELPYNTKYSKTVIDGQEVSIANWSMKRDWVDYAFDRFKEVGYEVSSAYTVFKNKNPDNANRSKFLYRDALWNGADLLGTGVASFGHLQGVHYQNIDGKDVYQGMVEEGKLPLGRALPTSPHERLIREMILQMKIGHINAQPFQDKFGKNILQEFGPAFERLEKDDWLKVEGQDINLTKQGLLRVDSLLPNFFMEQHLGDRYA